MCVQGNGLLGALSEGRTAVWVNDLIEEKPHVLARLSDKLEREREKSNEEAECTSDEVEEEDQPE